MHVSAYLMPHTRLTLILVLLGLGILLCVLIPSYYYTPLLLHVSAYLMPHTRLTLILVLLGILLCVSSCPHTTLLLYYYMCPHTSACSYFEY
jgi:hypothetical protein